MNVYLVIKDLYNTVTFLYVFYGHTFIFYVGVMVEEDSQSSVHSSLYANNKHGQSFNAGIVMYIHQLYTLVTYMYPLYALAHTIVWKFVCGKIFLSSFVVDRQILLHFYVKIIGGENRGARGTQPLLS